MTVSVKPPLSLPPCARRPAMARDGAGDAVGVPPQIAVENTGKRPPALLPHPALGGQAALRSVSCTALTFARIQSLWRSSMMPASNRQSAFTLMNKADGLSRIGNIKSRSSDEFMTIQRGRNGSLARLYRPYGAGIALDQATIGCHLKAANRSGDYAARNHFTRSARDLGAPKRKLAGP
jgi:hypothetical protein